ncbi:hypothetical protein RsTz2092_08940 [Deferribacterales bacterium RsTz2092]|nr:hypothetical protein AGMMS49941_06290 [Deferribacterales bacterium]
MNRNRIERFVGLFLVTVIFSGCAVIHTPHMKSANKMSGAKISANNFSWSSVSFWGVAILLFSNDGECQFNANRSINVVLPNGYDTSKAVASMILVGGTRIDGRLIAHRVGKSTTELEYYFPISCADGHLATFILKGAIMNEQLMPTIGVEIIYKETIWNILEIRTIGYKKY